MTRRTFPLVLALLLGAGTALAVGAGDRVTPRQRQALAAYGQDVQIELDSRDVPSWVMGRLAARVLVDPGAAAQDALDVHGAAFRRGPDDTFALRLAEEDALLGQTHVRMTQLYRGIPVVGGELIVHMTRDEVVGINGRFVADLDLDTRADLSETDAARAAEAHLLARGGAGFEVVEPGETVVWAGDLEAAPATAIRLRVAYVDAEGPQMDDVYVDAHDGRVLGTAPRVFRAKSRTIYNLSQKCVATGSELPGTLMFSEGGSSTDSAAMGAYNGTGTTYDYYKATFNRDSYDNAGANLRSSVHGQFSGGTSCSKNNAAWFDSPYNQMVYGDGDGTTFTNLANGLDVTAHEMTHAVTSRTANLTYSKESGALNEAMSDILGESTAFYAGKGDWMIGAEVYTPGTSGDALRYFKNPTADGYSADYYPERLYPSCTPSSSNDQCGVHGNSGIANLAYYLLCQGGTHPRSKTTVAVTGIGITKGQQIFYKALTAYMTSSTTFSGARTATANAATALYGSCGAEYVSVEKAWDAVGVPGTWSCGTPPPSGDTQLTSGTPVNGSVAQGAWAYYYITVPSGATNLTFATTNATGDVDIYTQFNAKPTSSSYTCRPYTSSGNETCSATNPSAGTWWLGVYGYAAGSYTVKATVTTATATYSISGNAGTTGATITAGGKSATSDASSNYTIAGLANGTYTVTPSKSGCTFSPASLSVTISGANVTGKNFTASCGAPPPASQLLANPGFESGAVSWTQSSGVITSSTSEAAHGGSWKAWLNGYGTTHTDYVYQTVTIPSTATSATLTFWLHIDTAETTTTTAYDTFKAQVRSSSGAVLATLGTWSNLNKATGYSQKSYSLLAYKGQTVQIYFTGSEDSSAQTSFVVDDTALNVQ